MSVLHFTEIRIKESCIRAHQYLFWGASGERCLFPLLFPVKRAEKKWLMNKHVSISTWSHFLGGKLRSIGLWDRWMKKLRRDSPRELSVKHCHKNLELFPHVQANCWIWSYILGICLTMGHHSLRTIALFDYSYLYNHTCYVIFPFSVIFYAVYM